MIAWELRVGHWVIFPFLTYLKQPYITFVFGEKKVEIITSLPKVSEFSVYLLLYHWFSEIGSVVIC